MNQPLVSVYIPTYNRCELLKRAIDSVRNQTYKNLEIIIVDDLSTDNTRNFLKEIQKEDSRIILIFKDKNSGACVSRNMAINAASGEYITGLDDDDYFTSQRVELFVKSWSIKPKDCVALFTPNYSDIKKSKLHEFVSYFLSKRVIKTRDLYFANYVGNQVFTKTEVFRKLGGFDEKFRAWQDLELWFRLSSLGDIFKLRNATYYVDRSHELNRISNQNINKIVDTKKLFMEKHCINDKVYKSALNNHLFYYDKSKVDLKDVFVKLFFNICDVKGNLVYLLSFLKYKFKG